MSSMKWSAVVGSLLLSSFTSTSLSQEQGFGQSSVPNYGLARATVPGYLQPQFTRIPAGQPEDQPEESAFDRRVPGEFENQRAVMLACHGLIDNFPVLLADIVELTNGRLEIILLVNDIEQCDLVKELFKIRSVPHGHVRFAELPHDTMWARDYGPIIVASKAERSIVIDPDYYVDRHKDDRVPDSLGQLLNLQVDHMNLRLDGGNLLSNGGSVVVTTTRLLEDNAVEDKDEFMVRTLLRDVCGVHQLLVLEPLANEPTGHADMFATFVAENIVVVGKIDPTVDPENAAILNRNADQLSKVRTENGYLQVVRIDMPPHDDGVWRTYTNVIYANGVLMMPTYGNVNEEHRDQALNIYSKLLPGWEIVGIDADDLILLEGALHCMSMNLGPLNRLPEFPRPQTHSTDRIEFFDETPIAITQEERDTIDLMTLQSDVNEETGELRPMSPMRDPIRIQQEWMHEPNRNRWRMTMRQSQTVGTP